MCKKIIFILTFLLTFVSANAQEDTQIHTVTKGETVASIAQKYRVTPNDIYKLNPDSFGGIKENDELIIPKSVVPKPVFKDISQLRDSNEPKNITYFVQSGDTKFGLSKQYGVSIDELESQNPHIINGLQVGHKIQLIGVTVTTSNLEPKEKVIYSSFKSHFVEPGETLYGISKANGLTVNELVDANKDVLVGVLRSGQTLKVPIKDGTTIQNVVTSNTSSSSNSNVYIVVQGDTKFGLSKRFGLTIEQLENTNQHIIPMLQIGHKITLPTGTNYVVNSERPKVVETPKETNTSTEVKTKVQNTNVSNSSGSYISYEIQPKETLYGLSKKAGMTIDEFITLNPILSEAVQIGMVIQMPSSADVQPYQSTATTSTTNATSTYKTNYVDLSKTVNNIQKKQVLLFLPFSEVKYNEMNLSSPTFSSITDEFLKQNLEFYKGAKIAVDSAKVLGLNFDFNIIETEIVKNNTDLIAKAKNSNVKNAHAIIVPFYDKENEEMASLVSKENIPVISTSTYAAKKSNSNLFEAVPSVNSQRKAMLDYLNNKNGNIIVINDVKRTESKEFIKKHSPNSKFIEMSERGVFNNEKLVNMLVKDKLNFVILDSGKNSTFISSTNTLLSELSNYKIQLVVLEPTLIPDFEDVSRKRFRILKMIYPSLSTLSKSNQTNNFLVNYKRNNNIEPTQNIMIGFDITFDALLRISQDKSFEASIKDDITEYLDLKFEYKKNEIGGYSNTGVYILQYDTDATIKEAN